MYTKIDIANVANVFKESMLIIHLIFRILRAMKRAAFI